MNSTHFENLSALTFSDIDKIIGDNVAIAKEFIKLVNGSGRYEYFEYQGSTCVISLFTDQDKPDMHYFVAANTAGCNTDWMSSLDLQKKRNQFYSQRDKEAFFDIVLAYDNW